MTELANNIIIEDHDPMDGAIQDPLEEVSDLVGCQDINHLRSLDGGARMILDQGGEHKVEFEDLVHMNTPEPSYNDKGQVTFQPISHHDFVTNLMEPAEKMMGMQGYALETMELATHGDNDERLFGTLLYRNGREDLKLAIGFRQGLDKSMSAGLAIGGYVVVCSNRMFCGQETVMRKHTKNIKEDLKAKVLAALWDVDRDWANLQEDIEDMTNRQMDDDLAYKYFGLAYGHHIIRAQQMTKAVAEWRKPSYDHGSKSLWRWYNSITEVYKGLPPQDIIKKHRNLHKFAMGPTLN